MKQQIFIIAGALIVLILILVWVYLLFFGTPKSAQDVFSEFGLNGEVDNSIVEAPVEIEEVSTSPTERPKLRQLTTKLVAGFREVKNNNIPLVYFVEKGTGHLYSINPRDGEEVRLSGTTIPNTYKAAISSEGNFMAVSSFTNSKNQPLVVGEISTSSGALELVEGFKQNVRDFSISDSNELLYAMTVNSGLSGYAYDLETAKSKELFKLPFIEATIQWSKLGSLGSQYLYPKPSYALEGSLFEAKNNKVSRLPVDGFGFSALANDDIIIYSSTEGEKAISTIFNRETGVGEKLNTLVMPEKCFLPDSGYDLVCANESVQVPFEFPDVWYSGEFSFKDSLYLISSKELLSAELMVDTLTTSGRELDITNLQTGVNKTEIYFTNKNDDSLWIYEI